MTMNNEFLATLRDWSDAFMRMSMRQFVSFAKENMLSMTQMNALHHIGRKGSIGVKELGEVLGISTAATSQMIDRMVQQGIFLRSEDPQDRRHKQIVLSKMGQGIIRKGMETRLQWVDELAEIMSPAEQEQVTSALTLLMEKVNQLERRAEPLP